MADITELIAKATPKVDFSPIGDLANTYYDTSKKVDEKALRDAFKGGIPLNDDGSPNFGEMSKKLYQLGDIEKGTGLSNLDIQRQQLQVGQEMSRQLGAGENAGQVPLSVPNVGNARPNVPAVSPSTSRALPPAQNAGGPQQQPQSSFGQGQGQAAPAYRGGDNGNTVAAAVQARVPVEMAGPLIAQIAAQAGIDPNQPLTDPAVRARVAPIAQRVIAQFQAGQQSGQPGPPLQILPPQQQQPSAQQPQQQPMAPQGGPVAQPGPGGPPGIPAPVDRGALPTGNDPEIQRQIARLTQIVSNPAIPEATRNAAKIRLEALQKAADPTGEQKEYDLYRRQGGTGSFSQYQQQKKENEAYAGQQGKDWAEKYKTVIDAGSVSQRELPQLSLIQKQMNDPNFYSGFGSKYNLLWKQMVAGAAQAFPALGLNPDAAFSQEAFGKVISGNILQSLGQLKGLGQIRVAEINLAKEASAAGNYSIPANKVLVEISKRMHERSTHVAEMAANYNGGRLDSGFDRMVQQDASKHPLFSDKEIENWHRIIGEGNKQGQPATTTAAAPPIPNAKQAPDGNWYVPDPKRAGKYLQVR